jgi:putative selenium metabolism hydrolase
MLNDILRAAQKNQENAILFLQMLIQTPSPSGEERKAARITAKEMKASGFDEVAVDRLNDVMGTIKGVGGGRSILFNGHLDHVPPGKMDEPYSAKLMNGSAFGVEGEVVYGRAASDNKGALAAMVMAGKIIKDLSIQLKGDFKVAAVSLEEVGGAGTQATIEESGFTADLVVIGEATENRVALGHRGGVGVDVVVKGMSCHASAPERGINALYKAAEIISRIRSGLIPRLPDHPIYGRTSISITQISVKPDTSNVVPEECSFHIDCRNSPDYSIIALVEDLEELIASMKEADPELDADVVTPKRRGTMRGFNGFYTDPEEYSIVQEVKEAVSEALGQETETKLWTFRTDGNYYAWKGTPVVGFGPAEERFSHTNLDHVRVKEYLESIKVYAWLACKICGVKG